jgi:hypothetical protein
MLHYSDFTAKLVATIEKQLKLNPEQGATIETRFNACLQAIESVKNKTTEQNKLLSVATSHEIAEKRLNVGKAINGTTVKGYAANIRKLVAIETLANKGKVDATRVFSQFRTIFPAKVDTLNDEKRMKYICSQITSYMNSEFKMVYSAIVKGKVYQLANNSAKVETQLKKLASDF